MASSSSKAAATLVVGATGATGKHVVQQLLNQGHPVHVIVRSKERMLAALQDTSQTDSLLTITEASLLDLSDEQIQEHVDQVGSVVSCLGHNLTFKGIFGQPRRLVRDSVKRLSVALANTTSPKRKLIVMGSDGVAHPAGSDDKRGWLERLILSLLRNLVPPHADNEETAAYLYNLVGTGNMEWCVIRPTDLIDGEATNYQLFDKPPGGLFDSSRVTRANVAKCMVDMITVDKLWQEYKMRMPVVHDADKPEKKK